MFIIEDGILTGYTGNDKDIVIPNGVKRIDERSFSRCKSLTSVIIPDSVRSIGEDAFFNCSELKSVTIGNGVTSIGDGAFQNCIKLTNIIIPDGITSIGGYTFSGCISLKSVTIGNGVESICGFAFFDNTSLTSIIIPDGIISIGAYAFAECTGLKSITIPNSVTTIRYGAFSGTGFKTKKSMYKAFDLKNGKLDCRGYKFKENEWSDKIENISICHKGYHYCENLFDIFNYYHGTIDKNIAVYECEAIGISDETHCDSKRVCKSIKPVKRLYREDVIKILNGTYEEED